MCMKWVIRLHYAANRPAMVESLDYPSKYGLMAYYMEEFAETFSAMISGDPVELKRVSPGMLD